MHAYNEMKDMRTTKTSAGRHASGTHHEREHGEDLERDRELSLTKQNEFRFVMRLRRTERVTYSPADLRRTVSNKAKAKFEPVRDDHAEDVEREFACNERSARGVCCHFRAPNRHDGVQVPCADTIDYPSAAHPG